VEYIIYLVAVLMLLAAVWAHGVRHGARTERQMQRSGE